MRLEYTAEQEELRATVRRFCTDKAPSAEIRRLMDTGHGYDPATWNQMATQLGLQGLAIPEEYGGAGGGFAELAVVLEETGRSLLPTPYLPTVLAGQAILAAGDESAAKDLLPAIAAGESIATIAVDTRLTARPEAGGWLLDGPAPHVPEGHVADLFVVAATGPEGTALFAVDGNAPGLSRTVLTGMDLLRSQARLDLTGTPARRLGVGEELVARVRDLAATGLAAEQIGLAQHCLDMAVEYAKVRYQFGRPIGSFQAVKHRLAEMYAELELARSAEAYAVWAADEGAAELTIAAPMAKVACSEAAFKIATDNVRVHGGIGFTWEHDAHLYFRRAKADELLYGSPADHRELLAVRTGLGGRG